MKLLKNMFIRKLGKINKHTFIDNTIMAPKATFSSIIKTRPRNKDAHSGDVINKDDNGNLKPKC